MADVLLDTTVFIDYYRGYAGAQAVIDQVLSGAVVASFSPITTLEVSVFRHLGLDEQAAYRDLMSLLEEAPLTSVIALLAARKLRALPNPGNERLIRDALIGATAESRGETVLSRNARDFRTLGITFREY